MVWKALVETNPGGRVCDKHYEACFKSTTDNAGQEQFIADFCCLSHGCKRISLSDIAFA
jgi:hypothetical protein